MWMRLAWLAAAIALFAGVVRLSIDRPWKPQGYSGLEFAALTPAANARTPYLERGGALVSKVAENSAAARARLTPGMVVAQIDGERVASGYTVHACMTREGGRPVRIPPELRATLLAAEGMDQPQGGS